MNTTETPEIDVAERGAKYFKSLRAAAAEPAVAMAAARWEQFFQDKVRELRKEHAKQQELGLKESIAA